MNDDLGRFIMLVGGYVLGAITMLMAYPLMERWGVIAWIFGDMGR